MENDQSKSLRKPHHEREPLCTTRPKYREGRALKAVKVYTISDESQYLLIKGVSVVHGSLEGLVQRLKDFGETEQERVLEDYPLEPSEKFTKVVLVKFARIQSARVAKLKLDDWNYMGEVLHVCYAPEFESVVETEAKLEERRRAVARRLEQLDRERNRGKARATSKFNTNERKPIIGNEISSDPTNYVESNQPSIGHQYPEGHASFTTSSSSSAASDDIRQSVPFQLMYGSSSDVAHRCNSHGSPAENHHLRGKNESTNGSQPSARPSNSHRPKSGCSNDRNGNNKGDQSTSVPYMKPRQIHKAVHNQGINAILRKNALELRDEVQGPRLPEDVERKRKRSEAFRRSETGDESLDESRRLILTKMAKLESFNPAERKKS